MPRQHKHNGVMKGNYQRLHSVDIVHKDSYAKKCHQLEINTYNRKQGKTLKVPKPKVSKSYKRKPGVVETVKEIFAPKVENVTVDKDNYISIDLTKGNIKQKGVRIKFKRQEGNKRRTVGLQIEK